MSAEGEDPRSGKRIRRPKSQADTEPSEYKAHPRAGMGLPDHLKNRVYTKKTPAEKYARSKKRNILKNLDLGEQHYVQSMSDRYRDLMDGTLAIEDLDDEEVVRGQLRASDGTFKGRPPKAMPRELYLKLQAEAAKRWENKLKGMVDLSIEALERIVTSGRSEMVRFQAATYLIERTMGKIPERIAVTADIKRWEGVASSILVDLGENNNELEPVAEPEDEGDRNGVINDL